MNPTIELRVKTMIRALNEIIIPAVDENNALAKEQAGLLVGHLQALLLHEGRENEMRERERTALKNLARVLVEASDGGAATKAASKRLAELPADADTDSLSHAIEALVIDAGIDGSETFKRTCDKWVIAHGPQRKLTRANLV